MIRRLHLSPSRYLLLAVVAPTACEQQAAGPKQQPDQVPVQTSSEVQGVKVGGKHIGQQQLSEQSSTQYATDVWENRIQTAGLLLLVGFGMFIWKNAYRHHRDKRLARIKEREWQEPP